MPLTPDLIPLQQALLGRYSIEKEIGRGGMGAVYLARDIRLERPVAIKVLHPRFAADPDARERFLKEARIAARLAHPNIVPIFAVESRDNLAILVMELVVGETLGSRIRRRGPLPPEDAERVLREVAWALGYAHAHNVIHRDLTLENILLDESTGRALLADFGLAGEHRAEGDGPRFGTPGYLAPEIIRGEDSTPRSDLYALGVVAWTALVGRPPFVAETSAQLLAKHLVQPLPALAPLVRGASRRQLSAVEMCLCKDPDGRPDGTEQLLAMLERAPEPVQLAPALRHWFSRWDRISPIYSVVTPLLAMQTFLLATGGYSKGSLGLITAAIVSGALSVTVIPITMHLIFETREMRRLRAAGFSVEDIGLAAPYWADEQQRTREGEGMRPLASRVIADLTVVALVSTLVVWLLVDPYLRSLVVDRNAWQIWLLGLSGFTPVFYLFAMIGVGIGFVSPGFRIAPRGRIRNAITGFWRSRIAGQFAQMAGVAQSTRLAATSTLHRPTAMVLGLAVEDLWKAIPESLRGDLGDVPSLAHTLQSSATELRDLIVRLASSERAVADDPEEVARLIETREAMEIRHREAVAMLEKIRLQLLRTLAVRQQTSELTQQLEAARVLEAALLREVGGHVEVRRLLSKTVRHTHATISPTPTPAAA